MSLPATTCRACRHPQCHPVAGSDLCAFCEDGKPCPQIQRLNGLGISPAAMSTLTARAKTETPPPPRPAQPSPEVEQAGRVSKRDKKAPVVPKTNGGLHLRHVAREEWRERYGVRGFRDEFVNTLIKELAAAPLGYTGEFDVPVDTTAKRVRQSIGHAFRKQPAYRVHCFLHRENPQTVGILKEARATT